jgi:WD40 repeat protein
MSQNISSKREKSGKVILILGTAPAFAGGGFLVVWGLWSVLATLPEWAWATVFSVLILLPGLLVLGFVYLSVLGPRNIPLTILGAAGNILAGLLLPAFLIFVWEWPFSNSDFLIFAIPILAGISALLAWWLRGLISVGYALSASIVTLIAIGAFIFGPQVDKALRYSTIQELPTHSSLIHAISWSPNGPYLVSSAENGELIIWDIEEKAPVQTLAAPQADRSNTLSAWSPSGQLIAGFSRQDNAGVMSLAIYDAQSGALRSQFETDNLADQVVRQIVWSPDNQRVLLLPSLFVWEVETGKHTIFDVDEQLKIRAENPKAVFWSPDSKLLMVTYGTEFDDAYNLVRYLYIRDVETWQILSKIQAGQEPKNVSFTPNMAFYIADTEIIESATGRASPIQEYDGNPGQIAWSPTDENFAILQQETITIWNSSGAKLKVFNPGKDDRILGMAWSHDGRKLALISHNRQILIWDTSSP